MILIGVYDAKARLSELIKLAEAGQEVIITRHDQPVAKLIAIPSEENKT